MGLFSGKQKQTVDIEVKNAININELNENQVCRPFCWDWKKKGRYNFGNFFFQLIANRIFNGMQNISWDTVGINYLASDISSFIERNANLLIWDYWAKGYAVIIIDGKKGLRMPKPNEIRLDAQGHVLNSNSVCVYSNPYVTERTTHFLLMKPILKNIDANLNNSNYAVENLGCLGILSSKSIPLSPQGKVDLDQKLVKEYGLAEDKLRFILTNAEMSYTPINLPVKDLEFNEKVKDDLNWLCNFFCVSPDMIFGQSTYNNATEATKSFYRTCIQPLAEVLLKLARAVFIYEDDTLTPSKIITYRIVNIPELNINLSAECAEKTAYLDLLMKLEQAGIDVSDDIEKLYKTTKDMLENV